MPRPYSEGEGTDPWQMQCQCLLHAPPGTQFSLLVRFLQVQRRTVERAGAGGFEPVASLEVGSDLFSTWEEAFEHEIRVGPLATDGFAHHQRFEVAGAIETEQLIDSGRAWGAWSANAGR